jgi:hypothetical protein
LVDIQNSAGTNLVAISSAGLITLNSQKITGLANGTSASDAVNYGQLAGRTLTPTVQTTNYTALAGDFVVMNGSGTTNTTLPTAPANGTLVGLLNIGTGTATLVAGGSDTIRASATSGASVSPTQYQTVVVIYNSASTSWEPIVSDGTKGYLSRTNSWVGGNTFSNTVTVTGSGTFASTTAANTSLTAKQAAQTATVTAASGNGTTITYTAANSFITGNFVTVTGLGIASGASLNVIGATIASASSTQFTVTASTVGVSSGTGTATSYNSTATYGLVVQNALGTAVFSTGTSQSSTTLLAESLNHTGAFMNVGGASFLGVLSLRNYSSTSNLPALSIYPNSTATGDFIALRSSLTNIISRVSYQGVTISGAGTNSAVVARAVQNTAAITAISGNGTTITVTAINYFSAGQTVVITGTTNYNGTYTIATATATSFTITNATTGATSTGTATTTGQTADILAVQDSSGTALFGISNTGTAGAPTWTVNAYSNKITNIANGTVSSDAATFGQIPTTAIAVGAQQDLYIKQAARTTSATITNNEVALFDTTSGPLTCTLPATASRGQIAVVLVAGSNPLTISAGAGQTINGSLSSITLTAAGQSVRLGSYATGSTYIVLANSSVSVGSSGFAVGGDLTGYLPNPTLNTSGTLASYAPLVSPSFTTPSLGVATATSINGTTIPSSATLLTSTSTSSALTKIGLSSAGFVKSDVSGNLSVDTNTYVTPTYAGEISATDFKATGLTGATAGSRFVGGTVNGAPTTGTFQVGDFVIDQTATAWVCTAAGSPGTWWSTISNHLALRSATATAKVNEVTIFTGSSTGQTITAPPNPQDGAMWSFINRSTNNVTLGFVTNSMIPLGSGTGVTNYTVNPNEAYSFINYGGGQWYMTTANGTDHLVGILATANGGTGLSGFTAANNALYSTSASVLTAGTLPILAGGTGSTTASDALTNLGAMASNVTSLPSVTSVNGTTIPASSTLVTTTTTSLPSLTTVNGTSIPASATLITSATVSLPNVTSVNGTTIPSSATLLTSTTGVTTFSGGTTGLTPATATSGAISLSGTLAVANGGTGVTSSTGTGNVVLSSNPSLTAPLITLSINLQTGTTFTPALSDGGSIVTLSNASAISLTIPTDASVAFPIGTQLNFIQIGAGQVTISAVTPATTFISSNGAASASPKLRTTFSSASAIKVAGNLWYVVGDIV